MTPKRRLISRVPFIFVVLGVGLLLAVALFQPLLVDSEVLRIRDGANGEVATVTWVDQDGISQTADVNVGHQSGIKAGDTISIWPGDDETPPRHSEGLVLTWGLVLVVTAFSFLIGLVADLSARGFGYVPGTGQFGQTDPTRLGETRGFYWRT